MYFSICLVQRLYFLPLSVTMCVILYPAVIPNDPSFLWIYSVFPSLAAPNHSMLFIKFLMPDQPLDSSLHYLWALSPVDYFCRKSFLANWFSIKLLPPSQSIDSSLPVSLLTSLLKTPWVHLKSHCGGPWLRVSWCITFSDIKLNLDCEHYEQIKLQN